MLFEILTTEHCKSFKVKFIFHYFLQPFSIFPILQWFHVLPAKDFNYTSFTTYCCILHQSSFNGGLNVYLDWILIRLSSAWHSCVASFDGICVCVFVFVFEFEGPDKTDVLLVFAEVYLYLYPCICV